MPLCPICGSKANEKNGKLLPTKQNLDAYRKALGVDSDTFSNIETRRYICHNHFDDNQFYIIDGRKILIKDALPRKLTDEERSKINNYSIPRIRNLKSPVDQLLSTENNNGETNESYLQSPDKSPKYAMVEVEKLMELLSFCHECGHKPKGAKPILKFIGSACISSLWCQECGKKSKWESQNRIPESQRFVGNVDIASAATLVPITYPSLKEFGFILDMPLISKRTFYRVCPTVWKEVENAYDIMEQSIVDRLKEEGNLNLGADGQFDSRGYSAYLCSVTFMDAQSQLIVSTVCLDKREEKCPSTELEKKGVEEGLEALLEKGLSITSLTTDRSKTVIHLMKTKFPSIRHFYDSWHVIKGKAKELRLECKNKRGIHLKPWCQPLLNHMWWSIKSADGDGNKCMLYIISALLHILDIHSWSSESVLKVLHDNQAVVLNVPKSTALPNDPYELGGKIVKELNFNNHRGCGHELPSNKVVLDPSSKTYGILQKSLTSDNFLHDVQNCSPIFATSANESYNSVRTNKYCTKNYYYNKNGFIRRTKLAVLDHNHKRMDEECGKRKAIGTKRCRAKHRDGEFVTKIRKSPPDFTWKKVLAAKVRENIPKMVKDPNTLDGENSHDSQEEYSEDSDMNDSEIEENVGDRLNTMILNQLGLESEYESDEEGAK